MNIITDQLKEVIEAVHSINMDIAEQSEYQSDIGLELCYAGHAYGVKFMDTWIWDTENIDEREWVEETKEEHPDGSGKWRMSPAHYEPMEPYLRKKVTELIEKVSKIKV